ncbi:MAG: ribonucleoside-diphosphate reductase, adenosylcobalamin-dependent, partial [Candidatus Dadabacteria bacterium]|nr:ribonucleoside-diphosphate reductase, adenosylcobalamin-dependent [Candidatus Dadabacteria bacterium]
DGPHDSYGGICKTDQEIANISKRRGGIGYDISRLRPSGLRVNNAAHTTTGAISFMHRFSNTGREVGQGGRRAAQMISISVHHPDVEQFAQVKNDEESVTGANIS